MSPKLVDSEEALSIFRSKGLAPEAMRTNLQKGRRRLYRLQPGVGKTDSVERLVRDPDTFEEYGLVVCLTGQVSLLNELLAGGPFPVTHRVLRARPQSDCQDLDEAWCDFETRGLAELAKKKLCRRCPHQAICPWPDQYKKTNLRGVSLVLGCQALLSVIPDLIDLLETQTEQGNTLLILDEEGVLNDTQDRVVSREALSNWRSALVSVASSGMSAVQDAIVLDQHIVATDRALAGELSPIRLLPRMRRGVRSRVQVHGLRSLGRRFRHLETEAILLSKATYRWMGANGSVHFVATPVLGTASCLMLAAGTSIEYVRERFQDPSFQDALPDVQFLHQDTVILNVRSYIAARKNARPPGKTPPERQSGNWRQLLDVAVQVIARNIARGQRTLVVTAKAFAVDVIRELNERFHRFFGRALRAYPGADESSLNTSPEAVPVVHVGVKGTNDFEHIENVIALHGYYLPEHVFEGLVNDGLPLELRAAIGIRDDGRGRVPTLLSSHPNPRFIRNRAAAILQQRESGELEQTLARVRFHIHPRTVILFQAGTLSVPHTMEFRNLEGLRRFLGLKTGRLLLQERRVEDVQRLKADGRTQVEVARILAISERTVRRHWSPQFGQPDNRPSALIGQIKDIVAGSAREAKS